MSELQPGTRIPSEAEDAMEELHLSPLGRLAVMEGAREGAREIHAARDQGFYRGLAEGGAVGTALGLLLGACLTALAWSHLG